MLNAVVAALLCALASQGSPYGEAERLAREGRTAEAIAALERILERNPADNDARMWIARLELRMGHIGTSEDIFRAVLREHPADVDARIGLGVVLTRKGDYDGALAILRQTETDAGQNADLYGALARAYRRSGDDRRALDYYRRAVALSPNDPDLVDDLETVTRIYGHSIGVEGFAQQVTGGPTIGSGTLSAGVRVTPRLRVEAMTRLQNGAGYSDVLAGGGVLWRTGRLSTLAVRAAGGPDNVAMARRVLTGEFVYYAGVQEIGASVRSLSYSTADVIAVSPTYAWDRGGRWRLDTRYTYSRSAFTGTGEVSGDHSVMLRDTWRGWRRVWINTTFAHGIESFEDLTSDELASLGASTFALGVRVNLPSATMMTTTWEHQRRSNSTTLDRVTLAIVQSLR